MKNEKIIFMYDELPEPLSREKTVDLMKKMKSGDNQAFETLVAHNIRLVIHTVTHRFNNIFYDKEELIAVGNFALVKAVKTFDISKNIEFTTYASRCISNEIINFLKKINKEIKNSSLETPIYSNMNGEELKLEDIIYDSEDVIEKSMNKIDIQRIVNNLPERDKKIIMLYFGFYNNKTYNQAEISKIMSISQSLVSKIIIKSIQRIKKEFEYDKLWIIKKNKRKGKQMQKTL